MATEYELTLTDYLLIMSRRALLMIGIFVAVFLIAIIVTFAIPPVYLSTGTILVESQQIPDNVVSSSDKTQFDERISVIKQRVLTRDSLLQIANKHKLFVNAKRSLTTTELIDKMRERVSVELVNVDTMQNRRVGKATIAFYLSFEDRYPEIAHQVTKDLVALFMSWNVKLRTDVATDTTAFLTQESDKLKAEVDQLENAIAAYRMKNADSLPEQFELRATMLGRAQNDLHEVERDIISANEIIHSLEAELAIANKGVAEDQSQTLPNLKAELAKLSASYTESHPDIRVLKRKIEALEQTSGTSEPKADKTATLSPTAYTIQAKLEAANARLDFLTQQKKMYQGRIAKNEYVMAQTPRVKQGLEELVRNRESTQKKYEEILSKKINARMAQSLESENKSERFSLLEPPQFPEKSFKPDRVKMLVMSFFLAIFSSVGAIIVLESIDKRIRGPEALTHALGHRPLVVIPYLPIQEERESRKRMMFMLAAIIFVVALIAAVAIHFLYMPLDMLLVKTLARLG